MRFLMAFRAHSPKIDLLLELRLAGPRPLNTNTPQASCCPTFTQASRHEGSQPQGSPLNRLLGCWQTFEALKHHTLGSPDKGPRAGYCSEYHSAWSHEKRPRVRCQLHYQAFWCSTPNFSTPQPASIHNQNFILCPITNIFTSLTIIYIYIKSSY